MLILRKCVLVLGRSLIGGERGEKDCRLRVGVWCAEYCLVFFFFFRYYSNFVGLLEEKSFELLEFLCRV